MWVKKYVEMREMLFKNWKWLFEIINQTPPLTLTTHNSPEEWTVKIKSYVHIFTIHKSWAVIKMVRLYVSLTLLNFFIK